MTMQPTIHTVALYARVSTSDQHAANQLTELRQYAATRGWQTAEYVDEGVSGAKDRRPALDSLMLDARRRRVDAVLVWSLDRFGRSLAHVVTAIHDLQERGVAFLSLREGLDLSTAAGRLQFHVLAALAEFERARIAERAKAGQERARREGKRIGRPPVVVSAADLARTAGLSLRTAARVTGLSRGVLHRARLAEKPPVPSVRVSPELSAESRVVPATM